MQVSLEQLTQAMQKVRKFAEGQKNVPGIMFDINGDKMKVCYSDGKRAVIETVDVTPGDSTIEGKIIVPYVRMMNIIDSCQPSGPIYTGNFDIAFGEGNTMVVTAIKKFKREAKEDAELSETIIEEDGVKYEIVTVSKFGQKIPYNKPEDSLQYGVLSRMDYDGIFEGEDFDTWNKEELRNILSRTSTEKNKTIYISSSRKSAFVINIAHATNIPVTSCERHGMVISTNIAGALVEILGKMSGETVTICVKENRYANIRSENNAVGVWFEMAPVSKNELSTLQRYQDRQYTSYKLVFLRAALINVISCAMASDNNEKTTIHFTAVEDGKPAIKISSANSGASIANDFTIIMERCLDNIGDIMNLKITVSLKVLYDMLNNCQNYYAAFDVAKDEDSTFIRIGDIVSGATDADTVLAATHYAIVDK